MNDFYQLQVNMLPIVFIIQNRPDMLSEDVVALQVSLVNLALKVYPDHIEYVDKVLHYTADIFHQKDIPRWVTCLAV